MNSADLLLQIESFLLRHDVSATAFSAAVSRDNRLVFDMRTGRKPSVDLADHIQKYMRQRDAERAERDQRWAALRAAFRSEVG